MESGMAQRRDSSRRHAAQRRRGRAHDLEAERWLLMLGVATAIVIAAAMLGPWPRTAAPEPDVPRPMTMAEARTDNARVPIVARRRVAAAPFRFRGGPAEREQAAECLATAALYEAGDDRRGQRAVIQVVLNRVRAPGFPGTVCGVVWQGHARSTGCQFSFTCDRSIDRRTVHRGWRGARAAARRALAGYVFADVGRATHYHTDWMVPYWRDSLTKVAKVETHLFYVRRRGQD